MQHAAELEPPLLALEQQLGALGRRCASRMPPRWTMWPPSCTPLWFRRSTSSRAPPATAACRPCCAGGSRMAGGQVAAQREALARATASLDRAIDVLIPDLAPAHALYSAAGGAARAGGQGGSLLA